MSQTEVFMQHWYRYRDAPASKKCVFISVRNQAKQCSNACLAFKKPTAGLPEKNRLFMVFGAFHMPFSVKNMMSLIFL